MNEPPSQYDDVRVKKINHIGGRDPDYSYPGADHFFDLFVPVHNRTPQHPPRYLAEIRANTSMQVGGPLFNRHDQRLAGDGGLAGNAIDDSMAQSRFGPAYRLS